MTGARPALVIGYGNTLRGDDALGPRAADAVRGWGLPEVVALSVTQLTPELAEPLSAVNLAIFVDARLAAGEVEAHRLEPVEGASSFGHATDPGRLLALAKLAYGRCPPAWLVTVPATDLGLAERLSPQAERGLAAALGRIAQLLG